MKNTSKTIITVLFLFCICLSLSGCNLLNNFFDSCLFYNHEWTEDLKFSLGINNITGIAFCGDCYWHGGDMSFTIPDEFMDCKITTLGGYIGRGVPSPFRVAFDISELYPDIKNCGVCDDNYFNTYHLSDDEYDILKFSVHIGSNLTNIKFVYGKAYYLRGIIGKDGQRKDDFICKIVYYFTVDENNPTFYAEDGKLFYRENNKLVTDFFYE